MMRKVALVDQNKKGYRSGITSVAVRTNSGGILDSPEVAVLHSMYNSTRYPLHLLIQPPLGLHRPRHGHRMWYHLATHRGPLRLDLLGLCATRLELGMIPFERGSEIQVLAFGR